MKSNKSFQKSKKSKHFDDNQELRIKKVDSSSKKKKNFKKEIYNEIDELEELDLFGNKNDYLDDDEDSDY